VAKSSDGAGGAGTFSLRVLVIRHAIADDPEAFARRGGGEGKSSTPDALRPLTKPGRRKMRRAARGLARLVPQIDALAASPLTRAAQTAGIVAEAYQAADDGGRSRKLRTVSLAPLSPGKPLGALMSWLQEQRRGATVALVGHEPGLGQFASWALTGLRESFIPLKKGGACLIEFAEQVKPGHAKILWCLKPSQLRDIADKIRR
jgi:phosphohistidine phosphatase